MATPLSLIRMLGKLLLLFVMLSLVSCSDENTVFGIPKSGAPEGWERRWLQGIPCRAPCWEGVTPGVTSVSEAVDSLRRSSVTYDVWIAPNVGLPTGEIIWTWSGTSSMPVPYSSTPSPHPNGGVAYYDAEAEPHVVYAIQPEFPTAFTLGEVVGAYGEPSHVMARAGLNPHGDGVWYGLSVVWMPQGFKLFPRGLDGKPEAITATQAFSGVMFYAPGTDEAISGLNSDYLAPWEGYQTFDYFCRDGGTMACRYRGP
jgi:hypothetical protein